MAVDGMLTTVLKHQAHCYIQRYPVAWRMPPYHHAQTAIYYSYLVSRHFTVQSRHPAACAVFTSKELLQFKLATLKWVSFKSH